MQDDSENKTENGSESSPRVAVAIVFVLVVLIAAAFVLKDLHKWKADALRELFAADPDVAPWILENVLHSITAKPGFRTSSDGGTANERS